MSNGTPVGDDARPLVSRDFIENVFVCYLPLHRRAADGAVSGWTAASQAVVLMNPHIPVIATYHIQLGYRGRPSGDSPQSS